MDAIQAVVVLTGVIAVIVSLVTAVNSVKQSTFAQLQALVDRLSKDLKDERDRGDRLDREVQTERERNDQLEHNLAKVTRWSHRLVRQLHDAGIEPVELDDTIEKMKAIKKEKDDDNNKSSRN